jgi:hypothetical protein
MLIMIKKILLTSAILISGIAHSQVSSGLVAKYSFNNGNANDEIGTNHGTVNGATLTADRFGNSNKAYAFDGISNYIDFGSGSTFEMGENDFSISLWVQFSVTQFAPILLKRNDSPTYDQYSIFAGQYGAPDNNIEFYYKPSPGGVGAAERVVSSSLNTTAWQHIVVVSKYNDSTYLYNNNQYIGSSKTAFTTGGFNVNGANLIAGFSSLSGNSYYYNGLLDDINIYDRALTPSEVSILYNEQDPASVGVFENMIDNTLLKIYPNPNSGEFIIQSKLTDDLVIANELGQIIKEIKLNEQNSFSYHCNDLQNGIYFLIGKTVKQKIIVNK